MVSWVGLPWRVPNLGHHSSIKSVYHLNNQNIQKNPKKSKKDITIVFQRIFHHHTISFDSHVLQDQRQYQQQDQRKPQHNASNHTFHTFYNHPSPPQLPNLPPIPHHTLHINPPPFHLPSVPSPKWPNVPSLCPTRCLVPRVPSAPSTPFIQSQSRVDPYDTRNHLSRCEAILFVYTASELQDTTNGGSVVDGPGVSVVDVVGR